VLALRRPAATASATIASSSGSTPPIGERPALIAATFHPDTAELILDEPAGAVAPGQAAVLYDGDRVLGGGWIRRTA